MTPERDNRGLDGEPGWINFEDITQLAVEAALRQGSHSPCMLIDGSKRIMYGGLPHLPDTHEKRMQFMFAAGQVAAISEEVGQLRQVFMISEAWMSTPKENEFPKIIPSEDPNRKEVLIISGLDMQKQVKYLKIFEMMRDKEGTLIGLTEAMTETEKGGSFNVPLLDAFQQGYQVVIRERLGRWN